MNVRCLITREKTPRGHARMGNSSTVSSISTRWPTVCWAPPSACRIFERGNRVSNHPLHTTTYASPYYLRIDMSFRKSFSGVRKKVKDKLSKIVHGPEKGANAGGDGSNRSALSLQSEPGIVVDGEFRRGDIKVSAEKDDPQPDDSRSVSRSALGVRESDDKAGGGETSKKRLHLRPHVQAESGSSQGRRGVDGKQADRADSPPQSDIRNKPTPAPSISRARGGESEST